MFHNATSKKSKMEASLGPSSPRSPLVGRRLSMALFDQSSPAAEHPHHHDHMVSQNFVTDVHLEDRPEEEDPLDKIIQDIGRQHGDILVPIFQYYCSYGDAYNLKKLKLSNYVKFIRALEYVPKSFPLARLQNFFKFAAHHFKGSKVGNYVQEDNRKAMTSKGGALRHFRLDYTRWLYAFCMVVKFKRERLKEMKVDAALPSLPLCVQICLEQNVFPKAGRIEPLPDADLLLDDNVVQVMRSNTAAMMKVYSHYAIPCGTMHKQLHINEEKVKQLFADFTIPQSLLTKLELFRIWNHIAEQTEKVQFPEFLELMGRAALTAYSKPYLKEKHGDAAEQLEEFLKLFRFHEKFRLIIEEHRQVGKQPNLHKLSEAQVHGHSPKPASGKKSWSRVKLLHKFDRLLKKEEVSQGMDFGDLVESMCITNHSEDYAKSLLRIEGEETKIEDFDDDWSHASSRLMGSKIASSIFSPKWKDHKVVAKAVGIMEPYHAELREVFEYYCILNNRGKLNVHSMDSFSWIKLLVDSKLIDPRRGKRGANVDGYENDCFITRAEGDLVFSELSRALDLKKRAHGRTVTVKTKEKSGLSFADMLLGLTRVAQTVDRRSGGLREYVEENKIGLSKNDSAGTETRLFDYKQLSSPRQNVQRHATPNFSRRGSVHLNWSPSSPTRLQNSPTGKESNKARTDRMLALVEKDNESMLYIHYSNQYKKMILKLADAVLVLVEKFVLVNCKRVSCYGYGVEEAKLTKNLLEEEPVVALIQEQEVLLQQIFTHFSAKRHLEKPFYAPKESRERAIEFKQLEEISTEFHMVPSLLTRSELFMCFRTSRRHPEKNPLFLNYSEWVECFARMALLAFSKPYLMETHPLPEHRLHGLFGWIRASEGILKMMKEEWAKGHGYHGVRLTKSFLEGLPMKRAPTAMEKQEGHELVHAFNTTMGRIREYAVGKPDLKSLFKTFDEDGNGSVSRKEFWRAIRSMCGGDKCDLTEEDLLGVYNVLDPERTNELSYGTFMYQFYNRRSIVKKIRRSSETRPHSPGVSPTSGLLTIDTVEVEEVNGTPTPSPPRNKVIKGGQHDRNVDESVILETSPVVYNLDEMLGVQRKLCSAAQAWVGTSLESLESYMKLDNTPFVSFENLQETSCRMSKGTSPENRINDDDITALYHMLSQGGTVDVTGDLLKGFLKSKDLHEWRLDPGKPRSQLTSQVLMMPRKPPAPPTMEEMIAVMSEKIASKTPMRQQNSKLENRQGTREKRSLVSAPKLFIRSPGEMKYLQRVRKAAKERARVQGMTNLRKVDPTPEKPKLKNKDAKVPSSIRRGSYFGTYDHNSHVKKVASSKLRRMQNENTVVIEKGPSPEKKIIRGGKAMAEYNVLHVVEMAIKHKRSLHGHTIEDTRSLFKAMDSNHSGFLCVDEMADALHRFGLGLSSKQVEELMSHMHFEENHTNGDICYEEFVRAIHGHRKFKIPVAEKSQTTASHVVSKHALDDKSLEKKLRPTVKVKVGKRPWDRGVKISYEEKGNPRLAVATTKPEMEELVEE